MATLEVLLREDVEHLGRRGEIVRVKAGFARNFLLPRKLAMVATSSNLKVIEQERQGLQKHEERERQAAQTLSERLSDVTLEFARKASEQGIFYGSVTTHDIAHALAEQGVEIERRKIHLANPIKQPGTYSASIKLHRDVVIEIPVTVQREGGPEQTAVKAAEPPEQSTTAAQEPEAAETDLEQAQEETE